MIIDIYLSETVDSWLDTLSKWATIGIALLNLAFIVYVFFSSLRKTKLEKEKARKINFFKTLILDYNLVHFYDKIEAIEELVYSNRQNCITTQERHDLIEKLEDLLVLLRRRFTDTLLSVDNKLYNEVLDRSDEILAELSVAISDVTVSLSNGAEFESKIIAPITSKKTDILKALFNYKG